MSAEILRRAASLMRERAEAEPVRTISDPRVAGVWLHSAHYLTMTPAVALAMADWLDSVADANEPPAYDGSHKGRTIVLVDENFAVEIARAYLGESA